MGWRAICGFCASIPPAIAVIMTETVRTHLTATAKRAIGYFPQNTTKPCMEIAFPNGF
jgi:hypothetical protein